MSERITCEHFELTEALKDTIMDHIGEIEERWPREDVDIAVFLVKEGSGTFSAEFKVHAFHKDIVGKDNDQDIYAALTRAKKHVLRQMADAKDQRITDRRQV